MSTGAPDSIATAGQSRTTSSRTASLAMVVLAWLLLVMALPGSAAGQDRAIHLVITERSELEALSRLISIDDVRGLEVWARATPRQLTALADAGYRWTVLSQAKAAMATMCPAGWVDDPNRPWSCYPSYSQYVQLMTNWSTDFPDLCSLEVIGASTNLSRPHQLLALKISDNPGIEEDEPEAFYTSTIHGDETTGFIFMLRLIDELLNGYGSDAELTTLVDRLQIHINPLANPDGTYYGSDSDLSSAIRYYTTTSGGWTGVDPNRNFPDPDEGPHPDGNPWFAETSAMLAYAVSHSFTLSANFHGGVEVVNYPWDTWSRRHPDDAWFIDISRAYADEAQANSPAGYMDYLDNGITNGWDWYPVAGGRQDYMNYWHGCREVTIEVSNTKLLPASQLPALWTYNRQSLIDYLEQSLEGVRGLVLDTQGQPVDATVEVVGHDTAADASYVYTDPDVGDYHRMLLPGTYHLRFSATGFLTQDVTGVVVAEGEATRLDIILLRPGEAFDLGDLPAPYASLLADNGARHVIDGLLLGTCVDAENEGQPTAGADGDDGANTGCTDDEAGLLAAAAWNDGIAQLDIPAGFSGDGCLDVWLDFSDGADATPDGDFADSLGGYPERVIANLQVTAATTSVSFTMPPGIIDTAATYFLRARLTPRDADSGCSNEEAYLLPDHATPYGTAVGGMVIDLMIPGASIPVELQRFVVE